MAVKVDIPEKYYKKMTAEVVDFGCGWAFYTEESKQAHAEQAVNSIIAVFLNSIVDKGVESVHE